EIGGLSLGWFLPTSVSDVKVFDDQNALILDVPKVRLGLTLLSAIRNNFALGDDNQIDVASFKVHLDEAGKTNLEKLPRVHKPSGPKPVEPAAEPLKLPNVSGKFTVNFQGTIENTFLLEGKPQTVVVQVDPSNATLNIPHINQPAESTVNLAY